MSTAIKKRQQKERVLLLEYLRKVPIVQIACEKAAVSRATYYRWRKEDADFARQADEALSAGSNLINDLAESQLLTAIRDGDLSSVMFWLKHHHSTYGNKIEITTNNKLSEEPLNESQIKAIKTALGIINSKQNKNDG
jgi:hypothetical protein